MPPTLSAHVRQDRLGSQERSGQIHADDALPFIDRHLLHRYRKIRAGIVDEDVAMAVMRDDVLERGAHRGRIADIERPSLHGKPFRTQTLGELLRLALPDIAGDDSGTRLRKVAAQGRTQTLGPAGHERHAPGKRAYGRVMSRRLVLPVLRARQGITHRCVLLLIQK